VDVATLLHVVADRIDSDLMIDRLFLRQEPEDVSRGASQTLEPAAEVVELRQEAERYWKVRSAALQALAAIGEQAPLELLLRTLDDEQREVRWQAFNVLAALGERAPLEPFLTHMRDRRTENQGVRQAAARALGAHPDDAPIEALLFLLRDQNDYSVCVAAAYALSQLGDRAPVEALLEAFARLESYPLRGTVARALVRLGDRAPLEPLIAALDDPDFHARVGVAHEVLRLGDRLPDAARVHAERLIEEMEALRWRMAEKDAARLAAWAPPIEPATRESYLAAVADPERERRVAALKGLASLAEPPLTPVVEQALLSLDDEDANVQIAAADALGILYARISLDELKGADLGKRVAEGLFARVLDGVDDVEFAGREAILALAPRLPLEVLALHAGDWEWPPRRTALEALAQLGDEAPEAVLMAAVADPAKDIRETALQALQSFYPDAFAAIVQEATQILLGEEAGSYFRPLVEQRLAEMIQQRKLTLAEAVATLGELFASPSPMTRVDALQALEAILEAGATLPPATREQALNLRSDPASRSVQEAARRLVERFAPLTELLEALDDTPES
jgi:HEAT repeat protein